MNFALDTLSQLLRIPSISTLPEHEPDMAKARDFLSHLFQSLGFSTQILPGIKHPLVYAQLISNPSLPTVLIYGHYDVQPPDPLDQWLTPPFEPTIIDNQIYARGSTDNKGQLMVHVMAVKSLIDKLGPNKLPLNVKFLIEGEEEIGSISIDQVIKAHLPLLKADYLIASDTEMPQPGQPAIHIGLRGLVYTEVRIETAKHDSHSGQFGGVIPNPAIILAQVISQLKDSKNHVLIPNFYKDVAPLTSQEKADFSASEPTTESITKESSAYVVGGGETSYSLNERRWAQPTLDVNGFHSGFTGEGSKTIIPARAMAKVSMRLVQNQDPQAIFSSFYRFVKTLIPKGVKVEIINHASAFPYKAPTSHPVFNLAKSALTRAFGHQTIFCASGGSIGAIPLLTRSLGKIPCLMLAMGNADDNLHAPNEHFSLNNYTNGISAMTDFYTQLS